MADETQDHEPMDLDCVYCADREYFGARTKDRIVKASAKRIELPVITVESITDGVMVSVPSKGWRYWCYPGDGELRNNGARYTETHQPVAPRLTLPINWTIGDVVDEVLRVLREHIKKYGKDAIGLAW